ncbi:MAG: MATE family efflux transporter [Gammaproteobacteria bacterium]|nr:MATE family efflux transporter [Gammaproteobacteria bacterium]
MTTPHGRVLDEAGATARLAGPLIVSQVSQVGMGFTDTVMAGRLTAADLAAVAMGTSLWLPIHLATIGTVMALSPTVAQLKGAGRVHAVGYWFRQSLWLAAALGALAVLGVRYIGAIMPWLHIDPTIVPITRDYLAALAWGMPGACLYLAPRFVSEGIGHTRPIMYVQVTALAANALGDYLLMYGKLGLPALGAVGAGWASALVLWLSAALLYAYVAVHPRYRPLELFRRLAAPDLAPLRRLLRLGLPIAGAMVMEVGLFTAVTLLMGRLGAIAVAAHQIALNYAALAFMVPLGLSMGTTIRVGHAAGAGDASRARFAGLTGMGMAAGFMTVSATVMLAVPERIAAVYTAEPRVAALAAQLLLIAALFQISDGLQVAALGALRGLKDTAWPMGTVFVAYWLVGLPLAWLLGFEQALGPRGLWVGLVIGLTFAALALSVRFHRLSSRYRLGEATPGGHLAYPDRARTRDSTP